MKNNKIKTMKTTFNIDLKWIIILIILVTLIFGGGFSWLGNKLNKTNNKLAQQVNLTVALKDSVRYTLNKLNEEVATKKSLQADIKVIKNQNINLTKNQKELISRIENLQDDNTIISAALIETKAILDSILITGVNVKINDMDTSVSFEKRTDSLDFNIKIQYVKPISPFIKPTITFNKLELPNKQFIEFHWENNTDYYQAPVSFSVTNTNPIFNTTNVDSYVIPGINKKAIEPTGWEKFKHFMKKTKNTIIIGSVCGGIGVIVGTAAF